MAAQGRRPNTSRLSAAELSHAGLQPSSMPVPTPMQRGAQGRPGQQARRVTLRPANSASNPVSGTGSGQSTVPTTRGPNHPHPPRNVGNALPDPETATADSLFNMSNFGMRPAAPQPPPQGQQQQVSVQNNDDIHFQPNSANVNNMHPDFLPQLCQVVNNLANVVAYQQNKQTGPPPTPRNSPDSSPRNEWPSDNTMVGQHEFETCEELCDKFWSIVREVPDNLVYEMWESVTVQIRSGKLKSVPEKYLYVIGELELVAQAIVVKLGLVNPFKPVDQQIWCKQGYWPLPNAPKPPPGVPVARKNLTASQPEVVNVEDSPKSVCSRL